MTTEYEKGLFKLLVGFYWFFSIEPLNVQYLLTSSLSKQRDSIIVTGGLLEDHLGHALLGVMSLPVV